MKACESESMSIDDIKKRHDFMINACHVKLKIGIELYRTIKYENISRVVFIYAQVSSK